jgi:uncharacterized metal-binding protein
MNVKSKASNPETLLFPCAGAAHCGRVSYAAALELTGNGLGQVFCLAAVAAGIEDKLDRARAAGMRVAIDGCDDHCARRTLETARLPVDVHLVLTDHGIERLPVCASVTTDARGVVELFRRSLVARTVC